MSDKKSPNLVTLQNKLQDTFDRWQAGELKPESAKAGAIVAREILRATKQRMDICTYAGKALPADMIDAVRVPES